MRSLTGVWASKPGVSYLSECGPWYHGWKTTALWIIQHAIDEVPMGYSFSQSAPERGLPTRRSLWEGTAAMQDVIPAKKNQLQHGPQFLPGTPASAWALHRLQHRYLHWDHPVCCSRTACFTTLLITTAKSLLHLLKYLFPPSPDLCACRAVSLIHSPSQLLYNSLCPFLNILSTNIIHWLGFGQLSSNLP